MGYAVRWNAAPRGAARVVAASLAACSPHALGPPPSVVVEPAGGDAREVPDGPARGEVPLALHQGGRVIGLTDGAEARVTRDAMELRFELEDLDEESGRRHAARLTLAGDPAPLRIALGPVESATEELAHPFGVGSALPGASYGYPVVTLDPNSCHYIYVDAAQRREGRVQIVERVSASASRVAFPLRRFGSAELSTTHSLQTLPLDRIYGAFWQDHDLDLVISAGELTRFTLIFTEPPRPR